MTRHTSEPFSSNEQQLDFREWSIVVILFLSIAYLLPRVGSALEDFDPQPDYRMPYLLSDDYWMFRRCARNASENFPAVLIGDSFVWGQYVGMSETLSHEINQLVSAEMVFNLGVNGLHPAAMRGILRYYGEDIQDRGVILHLNLLWMSSDRRDLRGEEEFQFNHPRLIPQFISRPACYRPAFAEQVSVLLERNWGFFSWVRHVKQLYFENLDIPNWTLLNPYENPLTAVNFKLPPVDEGPRSRPVPWSQQKMKAEAFPWVALEDSFQWSSFQSVIGDLRERGNRVFVIIGPFNPYLQTEESLARFKLIRHDTEEWLARNNVRFCSPDDLPSELYADASHPLKEGYVQIAEGLLRNESFTRWLSEIRETD